MVTSTLRAVDYCSSLTQKLHQCRRDNELLDCKILVNTADGCTKEFLAHKIIISVSSNILKKLVKNKNNEVSGKVRIVDEHCGTHKFFLGELRKKRLQKTVHIVE